MVLPVALAPFATKIGLVGAGAAGGYLASMLLGGKKGAAAEATAVAEGRITERHAPYEHYAPVTTWSPSTSYTHAPSPVYIIDSPGTTFTKKDVATSSATAAPDVVSSRADPRDYVVSPKAAAEAEAGIGTDLLPIAVIGAVAIIGYGYISKD